MIIGIEANHANKPERTGVEEYCWQIIQELKKVIPSDQRVILYSQQPLRGELGQLPGNWEVKILSWPGKKFWSQVRLSWEFLWRRPDVFFAPGQLIPFFCPKKTVVMIHDSAFLVFPQAYRFFGRQYLIWMNQRIVRKAAMILTATEFNKKELRRFYPRLEPNKIKIVPLAYDQKNYCFPAGGLADDLAACLNKYSIKQPFLVSVGRLEEKKNTKRIVQAFNLLKSKRPTGRSPEIGDRDVQADRAHSIGSFNQPGLQLVLIGKPGVGYQEVRVEIEKSPFQKDIIQPGFVAPLAVAQILTVARALVLPSLYEGFGLPLLEAFACGCPVIAAQGAASEEVGGTAGVYVDPLEVSAIAQAMKELVVNPEFRQRKVTLGLERVQQFSWSRTAEQTWAEIANLG